MARNRECAECGEELTADDRFAEINPCHFMYDGDELTRENMAWFVHEGCLSKFVADGLRA